MSDEIYNQAKSIIEKDPKYSFRKWKPKYTVISWDGKYNYNHQEWFEKEYVLVDEFKHQYWITYLKRGVYLYKLRKNAS